MRRRTPKLHTREITLRTLLYSRPAWKRYFPAPTKDPGHAHSTYTRPNRYPLHDSFLKSHRKKIRVFADIGCAAVEGAPTTVDAKKALGRRARVYAVDIETIGRELEKNMKKKGVRAMQHQIVQAPLPFKCDAIRFANVSQHMSKRDRRSALRNIWASLKEGGFLLGSSITPMIEEHQFVLRKTARGWEEVILR